MHSLLNRSLLFFALFACAVFPARAGVHTQVTSATVPPVFLTGSASTDPNPYYQQSPFDVVPVGKTVVLPIVVSGSGPMAYTATSSNPALAPIIKTGYPVMNIHVTYAGTPATAGTASALHSFTGGADGGNPYAGLLAAGNGNFYGTTGTGGSGGAGTVFEVTNAGLFTTLHSFTSGTDGGYPYAGLATGTDGNLYGTAETGGTGGGGTVFEVTASGSFSTLYSFTGGNDGGNPYAPLMTGTDGYLYGTTSAGGTYGAGTIFAISYTGLFFPLYSFTGGNDGATPMAGLITGTDGNLYGTTTGGGADGHGTVFQVVVSDSTYGTQVDGHDVIVSMPVASVNPLYSFTGGNDGGAPYAPLLQGINGDFYGTTVTDGTDGHGTIFKVTVSGSLTTLYSFTGGSDGGSPYAGLVTGTDGNYYGTTETDGTNSHGTIYQVTPSGSLITLYEFTGGADGANPYGGLALGTGGNFYGTTETDGTGGSGTVYQINVTSGAPFSGTMTFALLRDMAPTTTGYIAGFAQAGYYNNTDFFRITDLTAGNSGLPPTFIAQGGDPTETGTGSPGFSFNNEFSPSLIFWGQGQLAMANSGIDSTTFLGTNGAQFFITQNPLRSLDFGYTIFGQLLTGFDVMQKVMGVPLQSDGSSPTAPVVMNTVTVTEDNTDAILLVNAAGALPNGGTIKVNATDPAGNKAVTMSGTTPVVGLTLNIATFNDTINDPPFMVPDPNVTAALNQKVSLPLKSEDLEFDYLINNATPLVNTTMASLTISGNVATITPNPSSPLGSLTAGLYVYQPFTSTERSDQYDQTAVTVGLGSGKLTGQTSLFTSSAGIPLASSTSRSIANASVFGTFLSSNPGGVPGDFTATINWGDATPLASGTASLSVNRSGYLPTTYNVSCPASHIYGNPGIYPVTVTVTDTNGGVLELQNTAVISTGPIYPFGRTFTAAKGLANGLVGTFVDYSVNVVPGDYQAIINWGDGSVGSGVIRGSQGSFQVYGKHQYTGGSTYPVDVTINSLINSHTGYAWSTAKLSGVPTHQPPFAQSHIIGQLGNPGYGNGYIDEEVTLLNAGNIASGPITLKFYVSPTQATDPIDPSATLLQVGKGFSYSAASVPAGQAINGSVSDILLPSGVITRNKFLIMQVITSDPIGSHMDYPRAFADPDPLLE